jgi:hypothetical protein
MNLLIVVVNVLVVVALIAAAALGVKVFSDAKRHRHDDNEP